MTRDGYEGKSYFLVKNAVEKKGLVLMKGGFKDGLYEAQGVKKGGDCRLIQYRISQTPDCQMTVSEVSEKKCL